MNDRKSTDTISGTNVLDAINEPKGKRRLTKTAMVGIEETEEPRNEAK